MDLRGTSHAALFVSRNEACSGLCSKCYQAQLERQRREQAEAKDECLEKKEPQALVKKPHVEKGPDSVLEDNSRRVPAPTEPPRKSSPTRCSVCNKKVGLTGFSCKCGEILCGKHRHADSHACTFDHRGAERELLTRQNPVIKGEKLERL